MRNALSHSTYRFMQPSFFDIMSELHSENFEKTILATLASASKLVPISSDTIPGLLSLAL